MNTMNKIFTLLAALLLSAPAFAADGDVKKTTVDGIEWTYTIISEADKYCDLGGYTYNDAGDAIYYPAIDVSITGALNIPSTLDGYTVGSIGIEGFRGCKISSLTIPEGVTYIGDYAFSGCSQLTTVICDALPFDISEKAFEGITDQVTVYFPVDYGVQFQSRTGWNKLSKWFEKGVVERKQALTEQMYALMDQLEYVHHILSEKATESEAPELYNELKDLEARVAEMRYRIEDARTMEVVSRELPPALEETRAQMEYLTVKIENYQPSENIAINKENFPDANFRNWLMAQDYGQDGILTEDEIAGVWEIIVSNQKISDLTGIEYFTAMQRLVCNGNQLTVLDITKNTALVYLFCYDNKLKTLDVSKNTRLKMLYCSYNQLTSLEVSNNADLVQFDCVYNQLTSLDVSSNTALKELYCNNNQLTTLDVTNNTALTVLNCLANKLTSLDVSKNTALTQLHCIANKLTSLDVSKNTALILLNCSSNQLASIDVSKNTALTQFYCFYNQLTSIDVSKNTALEYIRCSGNQLTSIDVSKNIALKELTCDENQLTSIDVSNNVEVTEIWCLSNKINETEMGKFVESLPQANDGKLYVKMMDDNDQNVITKAQVAEAKAKGWTVYALDENSKVMEYEGSDPQDLNPVDGGDKIDIGTEINTDTNLDGNVVGNILYNISSGNGEYNAQEGCLVINKATSDETMSTLEGKDIFGEDVKDNFTGIVLKVAEGSGKVAIEAETTGPMVLKMKVGNEEPLEMEFEGKLKVKFPYNVTEETYVYIYGSTKAAQQAKGMRRANGTDGTLKIFGIEIEKNPTAIDDIFADDKPMDIYTLSGQKVRSGATSLQGLPAGVYIVGVKKVVVSK